MHTNTTSSLRTKLSTGARRLPRRLLLLSLLFHGIGKAHRHDEGNHVHPSTEGVKVILDKLELPPDQVEKVVAVVKNHLEMSKIILRRDFSDDHVVQQFADMVGVDVVGVQLHQLAPGGRRVRGFPEPYGQVLLVRAENGVLYGFFLGGG